MMTISLSSIVRGLLPAGEQGPRSDVLPSPRRVADLRSSLEEALRDEVADHHTGQRQREGDKLVHPVTEVASCSSLERWNSDERREGRTWKDRENRYDISRVVPERRGRPEGRQDDGDCSSGDSSYVLARARPSHVAVEIRHTVIITCWLAALRLVTFESS
jgi:hypothetical protein